MFVVTKGHVFQFYKGQVFLHLLFFFFQRLFLLQFEKFIDPVDAGQGRLDRLNLHAKALHRAENLGNIVDDSHGCSG